MCYAGSLQSLQRYASVVYLNLYLSTALRERQLGVLVVGFHQVKRSGGVHLAVVVPNIKRSSALRDAYVGQFFRRWPAARSDPRPQGW